MTRSLSTAATLLAISRRSYSAAAAAQGVARGVSVAKGEEKVIRKKEVGEGSSSWVPDPVTGFYRPGNRPREVDVAELRRVLLNEKKH